MVLLGDSESDIGDDLVWKKSFLFTVVFVRKNNKLNLIFLEAPHIIFASQAFILTQCLPKLVERLNTGAKTKVLSGKMSKDYRQTSTEKAKHESVSQKYRSPCTDAHYEAFILRSSWTVGKLYAANLNLGQSYVKQVRDIEKQRKVWLSRKEKEQKTMQRRFEALKRQAKHCFHSDSLAEGREAAENRRFLRQRAATVGACSQVASLEQLDMFKRRHFTNNRTTSQSARHGFHSDGLTKINSSDASFEFQTRLSRSGFASTCSKDCAITSLRRSGPSLRRTTSVVSAHGKSATPMEQGQNLSANFDLIPRWLPADLRSKDIRGKSLI